MCEQVTSRQYIRVAALTILFEPLAADAVAVASTAAGVCQHPDGPHCEHLRPHLHDPQGHCSIPAHPGGTGGGGGGEGGGVREGVCMECVARGVTYWQKEIM